MPTELPPGEEEWCDAYEQRMREEEQTEGAVATTEGPNSGSGPASGATGGVSVLVLGIEQALHAALPAAQPAAPFTVEPGVQPVGAAETVVPRQ